MILMSAATWSVCKCVISTFDYMNGFKTMEMCCTIMQYIIYYFSFYTSLYLHKL